MRALGEMAVHTPVSGSFSAYAYQNIGPFAGFFSGWNYWLNFVAVSMVELSVVGIYINFFHHSGFAPVQDATDMEFDDAETADQTEVAHVEEMTV